MPPVWRLSSGVRLPASFNWLFQICPATFKTAVIAQAVNRWNVSQPQSRLALEKV